MKWIRDELGLFPQRPYYAAVEIDSDLETLVVAFQTEMRGGFSFPLATNDLTVLIERYTSNLDLYADLSSEGENVEGLTDFFVQAKPAVQVALELSTSDVRQHRFRTTLAHELGHVRLHDFLWKMGTPTPMWGEVPVKRFRCKRDTILGAASRDWMEWQAGYASGAILMPLSHIRRTVTEFQRENGLWTSINSCSDQAISLIGIVADVCDVSKQAAEVRLRQLHYIADDVQGKGLFDGIHI